MRREIAKLYPRRCERSEAIHLSACRAMDCFASLAMTRRESCPKNPGYKLRPCSVFITRRQLAMTIGIVSAYDTFPSQASKRVGMIPAPSSGTNSTRQRQCRRKRRLQALPSHGIDAYRR
jgi:hypothetical protein